ncbi:MAG: class I SAM-dependent rRNA methyltransferase [Cytophagaceae bacterium]
MIYPILQLKPGREKSVINRHPWIFSGGIQKMQNAAEGDIIQVQTAGREVLGYGFYSAESQISCRMFDWEQEPADFESSAYWMRKMENARHMRNSLLNRNQTNCYRLLHAEGDFLPGLIVDVYDQLAVVQFLIEGTAKRKDLFTGCLQSLGFKNIYARSSASSKAQQDSEEKAGWVSGELGSPLTVLENGLKFQVDFIKGQKTGFFLDQRENRLVLQQLAKGRTVLNAFSYTGGFSVYAAAGAAKEVHSLDISSEAVKLAEENVLLNFPQTKHQSIAKDCFEYLRGMEDNFYDLIVLDPPAFAKNKHSVDKAARGYKDINMKAMEKIREGGLLFTFSCSQHISKDLFQKIVFGAAADAGRNVRIVQQLHQPADHPVNIFHPEGEYLKGLLLWVE